MDLNEILTIAFKAKGSDIHIKTGIGEQVAFARVCSFSRRTMALDDILFFLPDHNSSKAQFGFGDARCLSAMTDASQRNQEE